MNVTSAWVDTLTAATRRLDEWIAQNLSHFAPLGGEQGDKLRYKLKALDELCMYLSISDAQCGPAVPREIHDFASSVCVNPRYLSTVVSSPRELLLYAYPIIYMANQHLPSGREMKAYAISVLSSEYYFSTERLPCRMLDALFCLWQLDPSNERLSLFENVWLVGSGAHPPHAGWNTASANYMYTHSIFFGTKLGLDSNRNGVGMHVGGSEDAVEFGILRFLSEANIDLALELVLCQMLLRHQRTIGAAAVCLSYLFADIERHGHAAGPMPEGVDLFSDDEKTWFCNYHTSLVAALTLRFAQARYLTEISASLERHEASQVKLATLLEVGSIFKRIALGEITRREARDSLLALQRRLGPHVFERAERYLRALPDFT